MNQEEKSRKEQAEERVRILQAQLNEAKKGEKIAIRKHENHHKYMMGGVVHKYFPECYGFDEEEMNDIIGCAFRQTNTQALIKRLLDKKNTENEEGAGKGVEEKKEKRGDKKQAQQNMTSEDEKNHGETVEGENAAPGGDQGS